MSEGLEIKRKKDIRTKKIKLVGSSHGLMADTKEQHGKPLPEKK